LTEFILQLNLNLGVVLERRRERGNRAGAILEKEGNRGDLGKHALLPH
jgi:hypothetical protein